MLQAASDPLWQEPSFWLESHSSKDCFARSLSLALPLVEVANPLGSRGYGIY